MTGLKKSLLMVWISASAVAFGQPSSDDLSGLEVKPKTRPDPVVEVDLGRAYDPNENVVFLPSEWARFAGGFWMGRVGQAVFGTFPRFSSDTAFKDASEGGFGMGMQVDFGVKHSLTQSLRFRVGYLSVGISPGDKTQKVYTASQLEGRFKVFHLQAMYRWLFHSFGSGGCVWLGAAASFNYVAKTEPADLTIAPLSDLRNSYGVGYQVLAGWDYPLVKYTDLGVEVGYHPFRSFSALLSVRTSL